MDVVSACGLPVGALLFRAATRGVSLAVVCKATFDLLPVESSLAADHDPIHARDRYHDDRARSLAVASDLAPLKSRVEVVLVGHAHAPRGKPVRALVARLVVGDVDKAIEVCADRFFTLDDQLIEGPGFTRMPLSWERAAGGPGTSNPAGVPGDAPRDARGRRPLPNLQRPGLPVASPTDVLAPIGFGPIAPSWPDRRDRLRHHADGWDHVAWPERPLPDDVDVSYFNVAPLDQRLDAIALDARLTLENLHPDHPRLVTNLAAPALLASIERPGRAAEVRSLRADTLWIDVDRRRCTLTYRAEVALDRPDQAGRIAVSIDRGDRQSLGPKQVTLVGSSSRGPALPFSSALAAPIVDEVTTTADMPALRAAFILPFQGGAPAPGPRRIDRSGLPFVAEAVDEETLTDARPRVKKELPLATCAALAARMACRPDDRETILAHEALTEDAFTGEKERWADAITHETKRGKGELLRAYDDAYVAELEAERGPIEIREYAALVAAAERGEEADALEALRLPVGSTMRVRRVWLRKLTADAATGKAIRAALRAAREA